MSKKHKNLTFKNLSFKNYLEEKMVMYRIFWRESNGYKGNGEPIPYESAISWISYLNTKYPDMKHWCTPA
jgi:hypothetical protein